MAGYRVDLVGLSRLVDATAALESTIEDAIAEIERAVDDLHVNWTGASATAHREVHDARVRAVNEMRTALTELRAKLDTAQQSYGKVGPANTEMWP
ncbi:WXG100 family type VII secretion target [Nocardia sp. NPDC051030]|uniref:WXG100 family type VII secretion target n=1 Tax=Nocardia sp. NPDC051030 TaxID=3155162 RepID=UPI0034282569